MEKAIMTAIAQRELNNDSDTKYLAMGFRGCSHGIKASFIHNHFRGETKIPTFNWPLLDFPQTQEEEARALEQALGQIKQQRQKGTPIAAIVISPIHPDSGAVVSDNFLS